MAGVGMWTLVPRWYGVLASRSRPRWIRRALRQAGVQPGETVYDLGSGTGRVLIIAAREFGARAVGYEIEPLHCIVAWVVALFRGVLTRVSVRQQNLYKADLSAADVVFVYLNPIAVERLQPLLADRMRPGARLVSVSFPFEGWEPSGVDIGYLIFSYEMPPQPGSLESYLRKTLMQPPGAGQEAPGAGWPANP
jgi:SAM-dependent methyltransferase